MKITLCIAAYLAISLAFSIFAGKFIAYGTGSDLEQA